MKKHTLVAAVLGVEFKWEAELDGNALVTEAARKGFQEWLNDAASTAKPTKEQELDPAYNLDRKTAEYKAFMQPIRMKAVRIRYGKIKDGTYKPGHGGGGGARSTPEDTAWIAYLNALGHKEGGKVIIKKTLRRAQEWACRQWLLDLYEAGTPGRQDIEHNMGQHVETRFVEFVQQEQANNTKLKMGIEYHRMMATIDDIGMAG